MALDVLTLKAKKNVHKAKFKKYLLLNVIGLIALIASIIVTIDEEIGLVLVVLALIFDIFTATMFVLHLTKMINLNVTLRESICPHCGTEGTCLPTGMEYNHKQFTISKRERVTEDGVNKYITRVGTRCVWDEERLCEKCNQTSLIPRYREVWN